MPGKPQFAAFMENAYTPAVHAWLRRRRLPRGAELPYAIMQRNVGWTELGNGDLRIDQEVRYHPPLLASERDVTPSSPRLAAHHPQREERQGHRGEAIARSWRRVAAVALRGVRAASPEQIYKHYLIR